MRELETGASIGRRQTHLLSTKVLANTERLSNAEIAAVHTAIRLSGKTQAASAVLSARPVVDLPLPQGRNAKHEWIVEIYVYAEQHLVTVRWDRSKQKVLEIKRSRRQPRATLGEIAEARQIVRAETATRGGEIQFTKVMPPVCVAEPLLDSSPRLINLGIQKLGVSTANAQQREVVGVDIASRSVHRYAAGAPSNSLGTLGNGCGAPPSTDSETATGVSGERHLIVRQDGVELWRALVVRPAASSGTNGSGIELRDVRFRGDLVLERAHVPILNVKYDRDRCGPYRDWQNEETPFEANGTDLSPGFRSCATPPRTIMESGTDQGNFIGVAIFEDADGVHLVSEMSAGWYRYISRWVFADNGSLKARFGFAAVDNGCVCNRHHHHAYWRFQFKMKGDDDHQVSRVENPGPHEVLHPLTYETGVLRSDEPTRRFQVESSDRHLRCRIEHGSADGSANESDDWPFGRRDIWILRHRDTEIDDGVIATGPPYEAGIDDFLDLESLSGHRPAVWYAAHFTHDLSQMHAARHGHLVGPDLNFSRT